MQRRLPYLKKIEKVCRSKKRLISWLQAKKVLKSHITCAKCKKTMIITKRKKLTDKFEWRCPSKCRRKSVRTDSFFSKSHLSLKTLVYCIYFFLSGVKFKDIRTFIKISKRTITDWINFFREAATSKLLSLPEDELKIGGLGKRVQIDETLLSKKSKYNRGKRYKQVWLFGGIEEDSNKWFGEIITVRNRESLTNLIKKYIRPGTTIISDEWPGYFTENFNLSDLSGYNFEHMTVNHNENFVNPVTGDHTNKIEGHWGNIKMDLCAFRGMPIEFKASYIDFRIWMSRIDYNHQNLFDAYIDLIKIDQ